MKNRQFIIICMLIISGFIVLYLQHQNLMDNLELIEKIDESRDNYQFELLKKRADSIINISKEINTNTILKRSN